MLLTLVHRPLANTKEFNFLSKHPRPTNPNRFFEIRIYSRNTTQTGNKKTDTKSIYFRRKKKRGLSTGERSLDLELDLISYFWNFVSIPPTMRNNARDGERGKRQVRSLECLRIAKKIGRLLSLDAWLGIAALIVPPLFEWRKKEGREKKKIYIREIARGDYSIKSGVIRSKNRGETKITISNWSTHNRE